jgi:hypothetical protein
MKIYNYSPLTGEYVSTEDALRSPLDTEEIYLVPANATTIAPNESKAGYVEVFADNKWTAVEDHRGTQCWLADGTKITITELGPLPAGALTEKPVPVVPTPVEPTLTELKQKQVSELSLACRVSIMAGFESSALGSVHLYPSGPAAQANLAAKAQASTFPNLPKDWSTSVMCKDSAGTWAALSHTATQIQQVSLDWIQHLDTNLARYNMLKQKVEAAKTEADVTSIIW